MLRDANELELRHFTELRTRFQRRAVELQIHLNPAARHALDREFTAALDRYGYFPRKTGLMVRVDLDPFEYLSEAEVKDGHARMLEAIQNFKHGRVSSAERRRPQDRRNHTAD